MEKKPSMLLIGHIDHGKTTLAHAIIDLLKAKHEDVVIITPEKAREMKIDEHTIAKSDKVPFVITAPPTFPEIPEYKFNAYGFTGKSARNIRREEERKKAKSKKNGK